MSTFWIGFDRGYEPRRSWVTFFSRTRNLAQNYHHRFSQQIHFSEASQAVLLSRPQTSFVRQGQKWTGTHSTGVLATSRTTERRPLPY